MTLNTIQNSTILVDGTAAFDEILRCIENAKRSIFINMFIWRNDAIGNQIARAVLNAAERGVQVTISADRVGMILEMCEENEQSFFHANPSLVEMLKIGVLRWWYPMNRAKNKTEYDGSALLAQLRAHPNITLYIDRQKNDHSKYYVFDDRVLIFGGINIEDKERGRDCAGRVYQDYMLKLDGEAYVQVFFDKLERNLDTADAYCFRMNNKTIAPASFEMKERFLAIINEAQQELVIVMAYFAPVPEIVHAIVSAWSRGVNIKILISEHANFQNDSNRKTMRILMKRCCNGIQIRFSPKMLHTKLIYNENTLMFGSCNITNRAYSQLGELDIELKQANIPLIQQWKENVAENWALAQPVTDERQIQYSPIVAWVESHFN